MARITVEDCLEREPNRFALITLAAKRAKQILQGSSVVTSEERANKPVVLSLREIADGHVRFMTDEDRAKLEELRAQAKEDSGDSDELLGTGASLIMPRPSIADIAIAGDDDDDDDEEDEGEDEDGKGPGSRNGERPHD